jgi:hypothetical protein
MPLKTVGEFVGYQSDRCKDCHLVKYDAVKLGAHVSEEQAA